MVGEAAVQAARSVNYYSVGTVEFLARRGPAVLLHGDEHAPAEHPVTEMVTGVDLVKAMVRIAAGEALSLKQEDVVMRGHASSAASTRRIHTGISCRRRA